MQTRQDKRTFLQALLDSKAEAKNHDHEEGKEVEAFPLLPPTTTAAAAGHVSSPPSKRNKRAVTPRSSLKKPLPLREVDPRERELRSMRQLHSGLELEISRLNQQNKVLVGENNKVKKLADRNKDLKNEVANLKSHLALEKAKLQTNKLGFSAKFAKQAADHQLKVNLLKTAHTTSQMKNNSLQSTLLEKDREITHLARKTISYDSLAKKATSFMLKEEHDKKKSAQK